MTCDSAQASPPPPAGMAPRMEDPWMAERPEGLQAEDHLEGRQEEDHLEVHQAGEPQAEDPMAAQQAETSPVNRRKWTSPRASGERKIPNMEREAQTNKIEIGKSAALATKAKKELDIAKFEHRNVSGVVSELQRTLDRLEDLRSNGTTVCPLGSRDLTTAGDPEHSAGGPCGRIEDPQSDHVPSMGGSAQRSDPMPLRRSGDRERHEWLIADHRRCRDPLCTPVQPKRPRHAPEPAPPVYGRYGVLRGSSLRRTWSETSRVPMETPWRTPGSAHPGDLPAGAASNRRRRSTWKAYTQESLEERTRRSRGAAPWTSRRR